MDDMDRPMTYDLCLKELVELADKFDEIARLIALAPIDEDGKCVLRVRPPVKYTPKLNG